MSSINKYSCETCSETFDSPNDAQKHFSVTRHKTVRVFPNDETLECEECADSNIHQLAILRYGFNDMALMCHQCLDSNTNDTGESPTAEYTLANGALFGKLAQYIKFRDIECESCGEGDDLNVANTPSGQIIKCKKCLSGSPQANLTFVSEDDDKFLTELLGLKEVVVKSRSTGRRGGRRGGRGGRRGGRGGRTEGRPRRVKKEDPEAESRRQHYQESKEFASQVKSGSTVRAVGAGSFGSSMGKYQQNAKNGKDGKRNAHKDMAKGNTAKASTKNNINSKSNTSVKSNTSAKTNAKTNTGPKAFSQAKPNNTKNAKSKKSENSNDNKSIDSKNPSGSNDGKLKLPELFQVVTFDEKGVMRTPKKDSGSFRNSTCKSENKNTSSKSGINSKKNPKEGATKSKKSKSPSTQQTPGSLQEPVPRRSSPAQKTPSRASTPSSELVLPPYITKYHPSSKLKLAYDNIDEYYREMSFNVFLEDQLTNVSNIIEPQDLIIEWYQDQDKKNNQFKVSIPMKPEVMDKFLSDRFKKLKKDPFQKDQAMFLILDDQIPWYGKVATVDSVKTGKNRKTAKVSHVELIIILYKWNNQPLPKTVHAQHLKLLPASVPVSRIFNAMDNLSNPSFIKMLLGKEPIKQISFNNRVNFSSTLNDSQKAAIQSVLNNKISVVQGPPGTGKTSAIYETVIQLLESLNTYPILVVAASNIAIDNIAEKLLPKHGKSILRVAATSKEKEYSRDHPLASICLHHKIYDAMSLKHQQVQNDLRRGTGVISGNAYKQFMQEKFQITSQQVAQSKVILTTTVVAGGTQLKSLVKCPVVIMDEATQSSEPSTLIPLAVSGADKFVFVGDQKQLSCFSLIPSLSTSLFERVLLNGTYKLPHMLNTQYRMHPAISEFPRNRFYDGKLIDGIDADARKLAGVENPLYFWDTSGAAREQSVRNFLREDRGYTFTNRQEVSYIQQVLKSLIVEKGIKRENIGVITPYSGQRDLISSILVKDDIINPTNEELQVEIDIDDITNDSKPVNIHIVSGIMIASIDAFQGREKDFMIMSCVRSNVQGTIGFLKDERRLNVALTRAKYGLIMVGDVDCLKKGDTLWREYMEYLDGKKLIHRESQFIY
ncbi:hypothetical protein KGF57_002323 [Candida theae]|uniref:C2H2-type domain-containing protein n=1 Tax=Candida theae TaxID=1198502 RepID=A0AAD5BFD8_9ASCO|nr:uncharacterized protein KGF57_002323 [Candida theae]KAI5958889.1 hypothetical protein KGF57_002323 [Candida theae]